ncbi:hypothetical protein CR152_07235 [Massilia violaceinigra]|uniref:Flagellar FliJ protein n=1 Tax=Massilia violaceinigra TaxID=2045208 RepID=A0A2D2DH72_9BURK|nr:hypothetical protein [Massilia violaceinigra]ATQ74324.1 hypothetical protein CR152_07235 [Massilia violaceinigra]
MSGARFRYALEPILLTRRWDHDALLGELAERNVAIRQQQEAIGALQAQSEQLALEWAGVCASGQALPVERFARTTRYLSQLAGQVRAEQAALAQLQAGRDELVDRVMASQRAIEAVEEHRDEMKAKFVQLRLSGDFKIADDQWNTLHAGTTT